jgi:hypothetical protein
VFPYIGNVLIFYTVLPFKAVKSSIPYSKVNPILRDVFVYLCYMLIQEVVKTLGY